MKLDITKTFDSTLEFNYIEHILDKYTIFYLYMYFFNVTEKLKKKLQNLQEMTRFLFHSKQHFASLLVRTIPLTVLLINYKLQRIRMVLSYN